MKAATRPLTVALILGLLGCGGVRVVERPVPPGLAWPPGDPRVRLERIIEFHRGRGALLEAVGGREEARLFVRPYGLAWDGDALVVADPGARRVVRVAADGRVTSSPVDLVGAPVGVAACVGGLVSTDPDGGRLALLDADLKLRRWLAEGLTRPTGLACADGTVLVVETGRHRVLQLDLGGARTVLGERGSGPGQFNFPTAVAVDGASLVVGDTLNFRVQRLDRASGDALHTFGRLGDAAGEMPRIKGVAVDAEGHVWVSDAHTDRVSLYNSEGDLLMSLGGTGIDPGRFSFPAGIAAHRDGRVAVADSLNRRVAIFRVLRAGGAGS